MNPETWTELLTNLLLERRSLIFPLGPIALQTGVAPGATKSGGARSDLAA